MSDSKTPVVVVMEEPEILGEYRSPDEYLAMGSQEFHLYFNPNEDRHYICKEINPAPDVGLEINPNRYKNFKMEDEGSILSILPKTIIIKEHEDPTELENLKQFFHDNAERTAKYQKLNLSSLRLENHDRTIEFRSYQSHDNRRSRPFYMRRDGSVVEVTSVYAVHGADESRSREDVEKEYPHLLKLEYRGVGKCLRVRMD